MVISIFKFLARYYGITLDAGSYVTHAELKKKFEFLKRSSFDYAKKHRDLVQEGKILYVSDCNDAIIPYRCPKKTIVAKDDCSYTPIIDDDEDDRDILDELSDLPTYQVRELLSKYKNKPSFYKVIKRELIDRGIYETKKYKLLKEIVEMKESGFDDKYQRRRTIKHKKS